MSIADAFMSIIAKKIADNLDAKISSRLASDDTRINNLNATISSRLASSDSRLDKLDQPISTRLASNDARLVNLDAPVSGCLTENNPIVQSFGIAKLPIKEGYTYKSLSLNDNAHFYFANQQIQNKNFGLNILDANDNTNELKTVLNTNGPGYLFGLLVSPGGSYTISLQIIVDGMLVVSLENAALGNYCYLYLGQITGYRLATTEYYVASPNFSLAMFYNSLQIKLKSPNSNVHIVAVYV